jgi:TPR repeat protein
VESLRKLPEPDLRQTFLAAARTVAARDGKLSLDKVLAETGLTGADFDSCFSGEEDLINAIVNDDLKMLGSIVEIFRKEPARPAPEAPPVDAWMERRLKLFERSLASLEERQDKVEREIADRLARLEERFAAVERPVSRCEPAVPEPDLFDRAPEAVDDLASASSSEAAGGNNKPETQAAIGDFLGRARASAMAALVEETPAAKPGLPRWMAWAGIIAVTGAICAGIALTGARAVPAASGAVIARQQPQDTLGRMMALADSGDPEAQTLLALAYLRGQYGAAADDNAAMRWALVAAQQGDPMAQYLIGALTAKDNQAQAFSWFEQAALRGNLKAMHNLAIAYAEGRGVTEDDKSAAAWFNRAAMQGYVDSQFDLAVLFERGQGVAQNRISALKWYLIAAQGGDGAAASRAEELKTDMPPAEIARASELAAAFRPEAADILANRVVQ